MGLRRFVAAGDVHGDMADPFAVKALAEFMRDWKPQIRICLGDIWDFRALRGKANEEERRESIKADFDAGLDWLKGFKPTHTVLGNHDQRLWDLASANIGPLSDYARDLVAKADALFEKFGHRPLPYDKRLGVIRIGHLKLLHGFFAGVTAARQHALAYGSCLFGHVHSIDEASVPGLDRQVARSVGALCQLSFAYNARSVNTLRHAQGWGYGVIDDKTGEYSVMQAENINGKFIVADSVRVIAA